MSNPKDEIHDERRPAAPSIPMPQRGPDTVLEFLVKGLDAHRLGEEPLKNEARKLYEKLDPVLSHKDPRRKSVDYVRHHLIGGVLRHDEGDALEERARLAREAAGLPRRG